MERVGGQGSGADELLELTRDWGAWEAVSLYLNRCRVDTPDDLVAATWKHVFQQRTKIGKVVDFGAGDGRFARYGRYSEYLGYEIDQSRFKHAKRPANGRFVHRCAFSEEINDADLCIGNPPFVRNQDLPFGWRQRASSVLRRRTGVAISGLANAWQYFFLLALATTKEDGLCALVIPYEWVSRPSSESLRAYIQSQRWNVKAYRLVDSTFDSVLTTSSITLVDKRVRKGAWEYFEETASCSYRRLLSPSGSSQGVLRYLRRSEVPKNGPRAVRGLSPGTQKVLTLTEGERVRFGLMPRRDVVPCVTTLRPIPSHVTVLDKEAFHRFYRMPGQKCWLIRTDRSPSPVLKAYLNAVPAAAYQTSTCLERDEWWKFTMPPTPQVVMSMSFNGEFPKAVKNIVPVKAVGGVCGIYNVTKTQASRVVGGFTGLDIRKRIVAHSHGLRKIEISQINALLDEVFSKGKT